jgi:hypothetical protein
MKAICKNCGHSVNYHYVGRTPLCFYENCDCKEVTPEIVEIDGLNEEDAIQHALKMQEEKS